MDSRGRLAFALVIGAQAAHSIEEYVFRLYDVFAPARFVSGLFSSNLAVGFVVANAGIVLAGLWSYLARVRTSNAGARAFAWFWACLELANGFGHVLLAIGQRGYFPGLGTAPLLIATSAYLGSRLIRTGEPT